MKKYIFLIDALLKKIFDGLYIVLWYMNDYQNLYFIGGTRLISAKDPVDSVLAVIRGRLRKQDAIASSQGKKSIILFIASNNQFRNYKF